MKYTKPTVITATLTVLVIALFTSISFSDASQSIIKYVAKVKHKHAVLKHRVKGSHNNGSFQTLAKPEAEKEYGAVSPQDSLWFLHIPDSLRAAWDKYDRENLLKLQKERDGILGGTGSPLDTIAPLGPFHAGGLTTGLLVSSANGNYFACAPRSGGLWKSTNSGALWLPVDTPAIQSAVCIAESPFHPDTIFVSAGSVYKSTNGGSTFSSTSGAAGMSIACDQADVNTVYSGAGGSNGLKRSTDAGTTWSTAPGTIGGTIWDILALPSGAVFIVKQDSGIYYAANGKTGSFTKITSAAFPSTIHNIKLANCKNFPNVIYAAFDNSGTTLTAFCKSSDGGVTWTARTIPPGVGINQWGYPIMVGVSNTDTNRIECGIQSSEYSTNGGSTWIGTSLSGWDFHSYANFPGSSTKFLYGGDPGIGTSNWGHSIIFDTIYVDSTKIFTSLKQGYLISGALVSSANKNNYFACAPIDGLWKSTDAGVSWALAPTITSARCIAENPIHPDTIFVGSGGGGLVYKSTDGGSTFSSTGLTAGNAIACDRADANTVYSGSGSNGLKRSTDGGSTWSTAPGTGDSVWDILALPRVGVIAKVLISEVDSGIYAASNGKTGTFSKVTSAAFPSTVYDVKLSNCKRFPNTVYAEFDNPAVGMQAFCKSTDGGVTWTALTIPSGLGAEQQHYGTMLGVSNTDTNKVECGIHYGARSTDGGHNWQILGLAQSNFHCYANSPASYLDLSGDSSNTFLLGDVNGIFSSNWGLGSHVDTVIFDSVTTSNAINYNYVTTLFYGGDFASSGRRCIGGTQDNGSFRFRPADSGVFVYGCDGFYAHISQQDSNTAYISSNCSGLSKSTNFFSVSPSFTSITPPGGWGWASPYQINYADGQQIYTGYNQVIQRTTNAGSSWTRLNATNITGINFIGCTAVTNPSIYWGSYDGTNHHFYRIDNAQTAPANGTPVDLSAGLGNTVDPMGRISPYPTNPTTLYIGFQGSSTTHHHAWKVLNANTATPTWVDISGTTTPLPSGLPVNQVQANPLDSTTLLAATGNGLYFSTDNGADWYKETRLPTVLTINEMQLRASDGKLFLFTYGRGVWYCSLKGGGTGGIVQRALVEPTPATLQLQFSLYPTPAVSKLNITLKDALSSSARMVIYDMTGHMVSGNLWNASSGETQEADISKLASGVYFLQIQDGDKMSTQKFEKL